MWGAQRALHWQRSCSPMGKLFALPPGIDFPAELVAGLRQRLAADPPEAMGRVTLFLNSQRMRRRMDQLAKSSSLADALGTWPVSALAPK